MANTLSVVTSIQWECGTKGIISKCNVCRQNDFSQRVSHMTRTCDLCLFLRFRDTWGALVTQGLDSEIVIRAEWRVADGISSSTIATMIMPGSIPDYYLIIPDYYLSVRNSIDLAGPIVIGTKALVNKEQPPEQINERATTRSRVISWRRLQDDSHPRLVRILHAVRRFARMGKWDAYGSMCGPMKENTCSHWQSRLLVQSFVHANRRYFCSARDVIFMFIVISSERPRSSCKIYFDDRQRAVAEHDLSNVFLSWFQVSSAPLIAWMIRETKGKSILILACINFQYVVRIMFILLFVHRTASFAIFFDLIKTIIYDYF